MTLQVINPPSREPLEVSDAKKQTAVWHDADDVFLGQLISVAREAYEIDTRRSLIQTGWRLTLRAFPCGGCPIILRRPPVTALDSLKYIDTDDNEQTLTIPATRQELYREPALIWPPDSSGWPQTSQTVLAAVVVEFTAGYGTTPDSVPEFMRQGILLKLGHLYEHRESVAIGGAPAVVPQGYDDLVSRGSWGDYQ